MLNKMWVKLFLKIAAIFTAFVVVLAVANSALIFNYYVYKEKTQMRSVASLIDEVDLYSENSATKLSEVISDSGYKLRIEDSFGNTLFSSFDSPVADYKGAFDRDAFGYTPEFSKDSGFSTDKGRGGEDIMTLNYDLSGGETLRLTVELSILKNSATVANEFMLVVAVVCLLFALLWVLFLSRGISSTIRQMKEITVDMASLDFSRKLQVDSADEIGQLAGAINTLSETLDTTLRDLNDKNQRLQGEIEAERRLDKMRKGFVANVSHELKTPISIISGYAEGLKLNINSESQRDSYADVIINESARMNDMVLSLLDLSRMESGQIPLNKECYDLSLQIKTLIERIKVKAVGKGIAIEADLQDGLFVFADMTQVDKILNNYLSNALSHVSKGGRITVTAENVDSEIKVRVYNDGEAVPPEAMERIWESFYRGDSSHKRESDRVGLGLSIVKAAVAMHETRCGVVNKPQGVEFWFTLEASPSQTET